MEGSISIVIPVYNSEKSLAELYEGLSEALKQKYNRFEIILVDDGSKDGSFKVMCRLRSSDPDVKVVRLDGNFGQQNAILCGIRQASGDYVITMDDDLQHPPSEVIRLINKLDEGFDVVYGIPADRQHTAIRRLGTVLTDLVFERICGKPEGVKVSSFRVMKRWLAEKIAADRTSFVYISAIIMKHTRNIGNITTAHNNRKYGRSNYSLMKLMKLFLKLIVNYGCLPWEIRKEYGPQYVIKEMQR